MDQPGNTRVATDGSGPARPVDPLRRDLVEASARLLAQRALTALRGPVARGAVPVQSLAQELGMSRGAVAREVERMAGDPGASPLDLVVACVFDDDDSEFRMRQRLLERLPASVVVPEGSGDDGLAVLHQAISDLLTEAFADPRVRRTAGIAHLLQAAAALALDAEPAGGPGPGRQPGDGDGADGDNDSAAEVARRVRASRTEAAETSLSVQVAGVRLGLLAVGRRPRDGVDVAEVVVHLQCTYDGFVLRHLLDPARYPLSRFVDMVWKLVLALTVPADTPPEPADTGVWHADAAQVAAERLAAALAPVAELRRIDDGVPGVSGKLAASVLELVTNLADHHPDLVRVQPDPSSWQPARDTLAHLLATEFGMATDGDALRTADLLMDHARRGAAGRDAWQLALDVLGTGRHSA